MSEKKLFLLVDDSQIDLEVLHTVLEDDFDTLEATSASEAIDYLHDPYINIDAMLLDISMPEMDGFSMLDLLEQENMPIPPVFMISAEATQSNVTKALLHHVKGFIRKPFQKDDVFRQICNGLGITKETPKKKIPSVPQKTQESQEPDDTTSDSSEPESSMLSSPFSFEECMQYITNLRSVYSQFLIQIDHDISHYSRMVSLMLILLEQYQKEISLEWKKIELLSHTAFFVEIGRMIYPFGEGSALTQQHSQAGVEILRLNTSKNCTFFVEAACDICRNFYRSNDPKPAEFVGEYAPFLQMCILCERLDTIYFGRTQYTAAEFAHAIQSLKKMETTIDPEIFKLLSCTEPNINQFYNSQKSSSFF